MDIQPINYNIQFEPDLKKFTFSGKELIKISVKTPTSKLILNSAELSIDYCRIVNNDEKTNVDFKLDEKKESLIILFPKKIHGIVFLDIGFNGILNDRLLGFYRSQYKEKNQTKYLATTQFEAADARRAFPCWDEPEAKATFEISLICDKNLMAISNMPEKSRKKIGSKIIHNFEKTPVMSTYLIYLGIGEFEYIEAKSGKIKLRVITTKGNKSKGKYALALGQKLLKEYEKYFGIRYPLPKLDLIAIPDFAAGAMENWGAITFRETILLYDPKISSTRTKQFIAEVISHEIAHQWFGNLVTMKWWNDLWLNESFATFMATKFVNKFYPEWDLWDQFVEDAMNQAMSLDSLENTHPIDVNVKEPAEIREIFDAISYDKGGCILRMLEDFVSEKKFQEGLKKYLKKHQYKNAIGDDLWDEIGRASKKPVKSMVNSWLKQSGFPLVEISQSNSTLSIKQKRFFLNLSKQSDRHTWPIPLTIGLEKPIIQKLVSSKSTKIKLPKSQNAFIANLGRKGFYRVSYDEGILLDLKYLVDQKLISPIDRWGVQNDLFAMVLSGKEDVRNYLDFSDAYYYEDSYLATTNVASNLFLLYQFSFFEPFVEEIRDYAVNFFRRILFDLGWDPKSDDKHTDALLRSMAISSLGRLGDSAVIDEANRRFKILIKSPTSVSPDIAESVCSVAAWSGDESTFKQLLSLYRKSPSMEEKLRYLGAMCNFKNEKLLKKVLDFSQTKEVRSQNMQLPIMRVAANPYGKKILWPWLKKNWKKLSKKVGHGNPLFNRIVASISQVADATMQKEIRRFFKENPTPGTERAQEQMLERVIIHSNLIKRMKKEFKK